MIDFIPAAVLKVLPTEIIFGVGSVEKTGDCVRKFGAKPILIVGEGSAKSSGAFDKLVKSLENAGLDFDVFEGVEPNPSVDTVAKIIEAMKQNKNDVTIGLGGGSAMDAAKVAARDARGVRCVTVPTTSGSGSEVTRYAVLSIPSENKKYIQVDMALLPAAAIVDPALTLSCSPEITRIVGLDTLTHHIEGYFNIKARSGVDSTAIEGVRFVMRHIIDAYRDASNIEARIGMSKASLSGGSVIHFKPAGLPHGFSYSFYGMLPHGSVVATLLPYCWKYYVPVIGERSIEAAKALGVDADRMTPEKAALAGIEALWRLYEKLDQPISFKGLEAMNDAFIDRAVNNILGDTAKLEATPRRPDFDRGYDEFSAILQAARAGKLDAVPH